MNDGTDYGLYITRADGTGPTKVDSAPGGMVHDVVAIAWAPG
jgi:hypothetical protein